MLKQIYKYFYVILILLFIHSCSQNKSQNVITLDNWEFREKGQNWLGASVPSFVHLDLYNNGIIEDPFYRANELEQQWIENKVWEYRTQFTVDRESYGMTKQILTLSGIDTYADVYLNDSLIAQTSNYFTDYNIDVKYLLKRTNELVFVFKSTSHIADSLSRQNKHELLGTNRVYTRKPQFHFGWDWGPRFMGCGITKSPILKSYNTTQISDVYIETKAIKNDVAEMVLHLELSNELNEDVILEFLDQSHLITNKNSKVSLTIKQPQLWWPKGHGEQYLYQFDFNLKNKKGDLLDQTSQKFGIRELKLVQEEDELGKGFKFCANNKDIYAMGANWIPLDFFHTRVDSSLYRKALIDAVDANMNMLRVWGGGIYESDYFYDLCDSLGIMVWQDFMFACAMYPGDTAFINSVELEATQQIKRLRNHPSIALWCGNNENSEGWHRWGWQHNRSQAEKDSIWADYQRLFNGLLPVIVDSLTSTNYWESSPQYGRGNPKHQFTGDAHYWGVWHDAEPFENFESKVPRFMSEYGFQSFPEMDAIDLFAEEQDHHFKSEVMKVHQKHPRGNSLIKEYMLRDYQAPADFESFVYLSQVLQAEGMGIGIEAHRRAKPYNMGTLYWQFNDCWPVASWSSRDYYGNWKALHYKAKKAYNDIIISSTQSEDSIAVYIINETIPSSEIDILIEHVDYKGNRLNSIADGTKLITNSSQLVQSIALKDFLYIDSLQYNSYLDLQVLKDGEVIARKLHHFVKPKDMKLPYTGISYKVDKDSSGFILELFSDAFIKNLHINSLHDGRFVDNYFDLPANEVRRIRFYNDYPMDEFNSDNLTFFSVADTY